MTYQQPAAAFQVAELMNVRRNRAERVFDLHPALHVALFGGFAAFLAILAVGLMTRELIIPMAICFAFVLAAFVTPALWAKLQPQQSGRLPNWSEFMEEGVDTATGRLSGGAAIVQVLILPALLTLWALAIVTIKALV
jgi:Flp pilus assembly protein TadB